MGTEPMLRDTIWTSSLFVVVHFGYSFVTVALPLIWAMYTQGQGDSVTHEWCIAFQVFWWLGTVVYWQGCLILCVVVWEG